MEKNKKLTEGTLLKYIGKVFENFQQELPYMTFLGYDCMGWADIWVDYNGNRMCVHIDDVVVAEG